MNKQEREMIEWNLQRLKGLAKQDGYKPSVFAEKNRGKDRFWRMKSHYHTQGFIEGLQWALEAQARWNESHGH